MDTSISKTNVCDEHEVKDCVKCAGVPKEDVDDTDDPDDSDFNPYDDPYEDYKSTELRTIIRNQREGLF